MMKSGQRAHRAQGLRTGHGTANRQMREEAFGTQMKMRVHGQLKTYATQMMKMKMIMHMLPVMHVTFPQTALQEMGQSRRSRMKKRMKKRMIPTNSTDIPEIWMSMQRWKMAYMTVLCPAAGPSSNHGR